jgi:4-alpha-glucanotransferase
MRPTSTGSGRAFVEADAIVRAALEALGVQSLFLGIHDPSFPGDARHDVGRGSPYSRSSEQFLGWLAGLGFNGVQLGPQGLTSEGSASPYEGMIFSRNPLNLAPERLVEAGLLPSSFHRALVDARPQGALHRVDYPHVFAAHRRIGDALWPTDEWGPAIDAFAKLHAAWLERDALHEILNRVHRAGWWREWGGEAGCFDQALFGPAPQQLARARARLNELGRQHQESVRRYAFVQLLAHVQHRQLRVRARALGLGLFGDLQIGLSSADAWAWRALFLPGYHMGAPPSRTNPDGQPWGYVLLDPSRYGCVHDEGPAVAFVAARIEKMLAEYDGVRIDHPHGWVCPWVYRTDDPEPLRAIAQGARLFSCFDPERHPRLAQFAIPRPDQVDPTLPEYADAHVFVLTDAQVDRYARLFDVIVAATSRRGLPRHAVVCEILSTLPYPLARVLERHQLGRFRVVQKARLEDPTDVYRCENAAEADWVMLGNHDTPPIWRVVRTWAERGELPARAAYLAERLEPDPRRRAELATRLEADPGCMVHALFADMLACPAQHVYVFFADLLGMSEVYNTPGTVSPENWSLRVPPDFERLYLDRSARLQALHLPTALALALRSRAGQVDPGLARRVNELAVWSA